ncbi:MAG TPA: 50S ribosomal protein L11 methyltransferase, partial [Blastocatellia bacterium]
MVAPNQPKSWIALTVAVPRAAEEIATGIVFDSGSLGTITVAETDREVTIEAYFHSDAPVGEILARLTQQLTAACDLPEGLRSSVAEIEDQDWMEKWKEGFEATEVGEKFLIAPSWKIAELAPGATNSKVGLQGVSSPSRARPADERLLIRMDPGMAFGTGTHETTRLCLHAIEQYWRGRRMLDVGTGTGILAIAGGLLQPDSQVVGIDIDPVAIDVARENVEINGVMDT